MSSHVPFHSLDASRGLKVGTENTLQAYLCGREGVTTSASTCFLPEYAAAWAESGFKPWHPSVGCSSVNWQAKPLSHTAIFELSLGSLGPDRKKKLCEWTEKSRGLNFNLNSALVHGD